MVASTAVAAQLKPLTFVRPSIQTLLCVPTANCAVACGSAVVARRAIRASAVGIRFIVRLLAKSFVLLGSLRRRHGRVCRVEVDRTCGEGHTGVRESPTVH